MKGKVIIVSAPSGCGKSTIINRIMDRGNVALNFSVSATNRPPRPGETDGVSYHFITTEQFLDAIARNEFVEYEEVYPGRFYGTLKSEIASRCEKGETVLLDIDVKGGVRVKELYGEDALSIFIMPPSVPELRRRLEGRGTDSPEAIDQRVNKAEFELSYAPSYDCCVVNDDLNAAVDQTEHLISKFLQK
ncbi:MAG: guanylate kinase [Firmicutes bacterium]|nr:guanylate kinase [Bacillota bacterium]MCM1401645.1 guanylate kinase [Bacteroides sp.]MCM1477531.1 guanylate kinase [Bacteroides sp.]